ncbi:cytochrome P450 oxidoreductase [Clavulina sp. PMI_390]|nr:cytochrome P450 oxidoreductase [Clavulina sp. PMI_390]
MVSLSSSDLVVVALGVVLASIYLFKDLIFQVLAPPTAPSKAPGKANGYAANGSATEAGADSRDFVAKMKAAKKRLAIIYGSQTGTAEDYAIRIAKEAKAKFGLGSLVCDAEEYDYENLDTVPADSAVIFVMASYGEGEPTDNAVQLFSNLRDDNFTFTNGEHSLAGLKYVVFGLGNSTYEHYNIVSKQVDEALTKAGATRIGVLGQGDDDKSMEEDYLAWKDGMWEALGKALGVEEGAGAETPDFAVSELSTVDQAKVYLGELSARALTRTKGIHDVKNPFPAPIPVIRELFQSTVDRNCVHVEFSIEGSGMTYQHGDHVGVWPTNPDVEVDRLLLALGLWDKKDKAVTVESLDPALAKVPFPTPTTFDTILRHYIDITAVVGRQALNALSKYAPTPEAGARLAQLGSDKDLYHTHVAKPCLKLGEVLQIAAGDQTRNFCDSTHPGTDNVTAWPIPFDVVVSTIPRLQPRYYSISSSPKVHPSSIHVTCVVLKYENAPDSPENAKWIFGVGSNYLLNLKMAANGDQPPPVQVQQVNPGKDGLAYAYAHPTYAIAGPRSAYKPEVTENADGKFILYKAPIHVRRSTFRLPTNPKSPILMIGPGTGVAPFRGFVQERMALAQKALDKNGPDAIANWGQFALYYGCRSDKEDYLYADEWPMYLDALKGKFTMRTAFSRSGPRKPDGSKIYVQDLLWQDKESIRKMIWDVKGYVYICGDAKAMSKAVEDVLARILAEAKTGKTGDEVDMAVGQAELKMMKDRSRILLDVWS